MILRKLNEARWWNLLHNVHNVLKIYTVALCQFCKVMYVEHNFAKLPLFDHIVDIALQTL